MGMILSTSLDDHLYGRVETATLTVGYSGGTSPTISDDSGHVWTKQSDTGSVAVFETVV